MSYETDLREAELWKDTFFEEEVNQVTRDYFK